MTSSARDPQGGPGATPLLLLPRPAAHSRRAAELPAHTSLSSGAQPEEDCAGRAQAEQQQGTAVPTSLPRPWRARARPCGWAAQACALVHASIGQNLHAWVHGKFLVQCCAALSCVALRGSAQSFTARLLRCALAQAEYCGVSLETLRGRALWGSWQATSGCRALCCTPSASPTTDPRSTMS